LYWEIQRENVLNVLPGSVLQQYIARHTAAYLLPRNATSKPVGKPSFLLDGLLWEVTRRKLKQVRWKNCRCQQ